MADKPRIFTDTEKETVARMAGHGLNMDMCATALDMHLRTFYRYPELVKIYKDAYVFTMGKIAYNMLERACSDHPDSSKLMTYLGNTRMGWSKDKDPFVPDIDLAGTYKEQKTQLKQLLKNKEITIKQYNELSTTLNDDYKVEEMEEIKKRLDELENSKSTYNKT